MKVEMLPRKAGKNLNDANTYELSALQQAVGHEFPRS